MYGSHEEAVIKPSFDFVKAEACIVLEEAQTELDIAIKCSTFG